MQIRDKRANTAIEEELHDIAHIDYDRVAIVYWENVPAQKYPEPDANQRHRFPTLQLLPFTKMLSCTNPALPFRLPVL